MTSPYPLLYNTPYHIFSRGTNGENIFIQERNYEYFLKLYERHITPIVDTFAYCMLRNHFHIVVRIKSEEEILQKIKTSMISSVKQNTNQSGRSLTPDYPSRRFSNFLNAYAKSINIAYGRTGSLFEHPFGRISISSDRQFLNVIAYIHQNPQKHKFVKDFRDWKYSSYGVVLSDRQTIVKREEVIKWFGNRDEYLLLHNNWITDAQSSWFAGNDYA